MPSEDRADPSAATPRDCLSCPRGEKRPAEFNWNPGCVGVHPVCGSCLRESLSKNVNRLGPYEQTKIENRGISSFVAGYATPRDDSSIKIVTERGLDGFYRLVGGGLDE